MDSLEFADNRGDLGVESVGPFERYPVLVHEFDSIFNEELDREWE